MLKKCKTCNETKEIEKFNKSSRHLDGYLHECKQCRSIINKKKAIENREKRFKYYDSNLDKQKTCTKCDQVKTLKDFYKTDRKADGATSQCKVCLKKKSNKYHWNNHEEVLKKKRIRSKKYYKEVISEEQREKRKEYTRKWRCDNSEHIKKYNKWYKDNNKALCKEISSRRRVQKLNAHLESVTREDIRKVYADVPEGYHVDHIIPLMHPDICGLHVPWNMQYLPYKENHSKNNKFDGTYENESWRSEVRFKDE